MSGKRIDALWDALWEDLRHNATGRPSGLLIITKHRYAIEAEAGELDVAWAEAEAALPAPEGIGPALGPTRTWLPLDSAGTTWSASATVGENRFLAVADTPAAALRALASKLREMSR
jgi:hypothetical protein